jgi:hypothetical protein
MILFLGTTSCLADQTNLSQAEQDQLEASKDTMQKLQERLNDANSYTQTRLKRFAPKEQDYWQEERYKQHEWYDGNPDWIEDWISSDTDAIVGDFFECLDLTVVGWMVYYIPVLDILVLELTVDYWWPEVVGEASDFCIGSFLAGQLRSTILDIREEIMPLALTQLKTKDGKTAFDMESFKQLRSDDKRKGFTSTPDLNETNHFESRVHRTFFDYILAYISENTDVFEDINLNCVADCLKYNANWFPINFSEALISPLWRIPELSIARLNDEDDYDELYQNVFTKALTPGFLYHGLTKSPLIKVDGTDFGLDIGLKRDTCSSYRDNGIRDILPSIQANTDNEELKKNCYHSSVGQLYPLVGSIDAPSERTSPIAAVRRMFEWQSMSLWGDTLRQNYFNDFDGDNLWRTPGETDTHTDNRKPDKLQRIRPAPSACYKMKDINERNGELWPKGLQEEDKDGIGVRKEVHWNRRRCRVWINISELDCFAGKPLEE